MVNKKRLDGLLGLWPIERISRPVMTGSARRRKSKTVEVLSLTCRTESVIAWLEHRATDAIDAFS
jgi:hypothetical protein